MTTNITILKLQESNGMKSTGNSSSTNNSVNNIWGYNTELEGNKDILSTTSKTNLTSAEQKLYDTIYKKIEETCRDENIDINLAKGFNLLEKIVGKTSKELVELVKTEAGKKEIDKGG